MGRAFRRLAAPVGLLAAVALIGAACGLSGPEPPAISGGGDEPASSPRTAPPEPVRGGTVTVALATDPGDVFNPWVDAAGSAHDIAGLIFGTLLEWSGSPDFYTAGTPGAMAEDYGLSEDGLEMTFRLKPGIRWHDGRPFSADDVVFTFRALMHPDYDGIRRYDFTGLRGVEALLAAYAGIDAGAAGDPLAAATAKTEAWQEWIEAARAVEAVDEVTVVFRFDHVHGPVLGHIGGAPILARHQFADVPVSQWPEAAASLRPVGTGPFALAEHRPGDAVVLESFAGYFGRRPYLDRIVFRVVSPADMVAALAQGEVDLIGVGAEPPAPETIHALEGLPGVQVWRAPGFGYQFMFINLNQPRFQDPAVRRAMALAVDRPALVDRLLGGLGRVVDFPLPPGWPAPEGIEVYRHDPQGAAALLDEAGWRDADGDGVREQDLNGDGRIDTQGCGGPGYGQGPAGLCETLSVRLLYPAGDALREAAAPLIAGWLNAVGFDVRPEPADFNTMLQRVLLQVPRDYDLGLLGWELGVDPDPSTVWRCGELYNFVDFCEDTVGPEATRAETLIEAGLRTYDPVQRGVLYREWAAVLHRQLPYVFLFSPDRITAAADRVRGVNRDHRGPLHNAQEWWVAPPGP